jgi:hypothetical protein
MAELVLLGIQMQTFLHEEECKPYRFFSGPGPTLIQLCDALAARSDMCAFESNEWFRPRVQTIANYLVLMTDLVYKCPNHRVPDLDDWHTEYGLHGSVHDGNRFAPSELVSTLSPSELDSILTDPVDVVMSPSWTWDYLWRGFEIVARDQRGNDDDSRSGGLG